MRFPITKDQLKASFKHNTKIDTWYDLMANMLPRYEIDTPLRIAAFLAQCAHESLEFTVIEENLNYSEGALNKVFGKYFHDRDAGDYARRPEKIANLVYANRMGNGDEQSGDGWRYRGRGVIQLTGKNNYKAFADYLGEPVVDNIIGYLETDTGALESACWFWSKNNLNDIADTGDMKQLTRRINGGYNGLEDRIAHYNHILKVLGIKPPENNVSRTLRRGDRGPDVAKLQEALGINPADGIFGPGTERAVKQFQEWSGLTSDGIAGQNTLHKLFG